MGGGAATGMAWAAATGMAWAADPQEGTWPTQASDNGNYGLVRIAPCADRFCGTLVAAFDSAGGKRAPDNIGKEILWDMQAQGKGYYNAGRIWASDRDKTHASTMTLSGETLPVAGCVLGGLICRSQTWTRVK